MSNALLEELIAQIKLLQQRVSNLERNEPGSVGESVVITPQGSSGAPSSGTWLKGSLIVDSAGVLYICTTAGTPGTWGKVGAQ